MTLSAFSYHDCTSPGKRNQHFPKFSGSLPKTPLNLYSEQIPEKPKQHLTMPAHSLPQPRRKSAHSTRFFRLKNGACFLVPIPSELQQAFLLPDFQNPNFSHRNDTIGPVLSVSQFPKNSELFRILRLPIFGFPQIKKSGRLPNHNPQRKRLPLTEIAAVQPSGNHIKKPTPLWTAHSRGVRSDSAAL